MKDKQFRFQELAIWQRGAAVSGEPGARSQEHGAGSFSAADFANFLNSARRSVFAVANILLILAKDEYLPTERIQPLVSELEEQSRMLLALRRSRKS